MLNVDITHRMDTFSLDARFCCNSGEVTALFGPSGAGKTSVINMIAGLIRPQRGYIAIDGAVLCDTEQGIHVPPHRRHAGYVFQESRLFPHFTVAGNLTYGQNRKGGAAPLAGFDDVVSVLNLGGLLKGRPASLSGGERQRVAIGRALLSNPRFLLMDEPLASLDLARKAEIIPLIEQIRSLCQIPILYVSHAVDEILRLADRMVLIEQGSVSATGTVETVFSRLDLRQTVGQEDAGAVLNVRVAAHDRAFALTELAFAGGNLYVPQIDAPEGSDLRVRILARDIALSLSAPEDASMLNILPATVSEISAPHGPYVEIGLDAGAPLIARLTRKSQARLGLVAGKQVFALIKAVSISRQNLGGRLTGPGQAEDRRAPPDPDTRRRG